MSNSTNTTTNTSLRLALRKKQISILKDTLATLNHVSVYESNSSTFDISVKTTDQVDRSYTRQGLPVLKLQLRLADGFPETPPTICVLGGGWSHEWLGASGIVVGYKGLGGGWTTHSSLGRVVSEVITELRERCVYTYPNTYPTSHQQQHQQHQQHTIPPPYTRNPLTSVPLPAPIHPTNPTPPPPPPPPPPSQDIYELNTMTIQQLEELVGGGGTVALEQVLMGCRHVVDMEKRKGDLVKENEAIARTNLGLEENLTAAKTSLQSRQSELAGHVQQFNLNVATHQDELLRFAPDYLTSRIRAGVSESEDISETIFQGFGEGKVSVEDFIKNFRETRKVYHLRNAALEIVVRDPGVL